jgi:hypothetical protein
MHCGRKDRKLFKTAIGLLCQVIQQTGDLTLLTDGEKRYGGIRFTRDSWVSVRYAEELNSSKSSVLFQRADRHGILGEKPPDFQVSL